MVEVHAEDKQHQRIVKRLVNAFIKKGCLPGEISISGIQNPDIKEWAEKKGVVWDPQQKVDIIAPEDYEEVK